jgi:hypothetical protein
MLSIGLFDNALTRVCQVNLKTAAIIGILNARNVALFLQAIQRCSHRAAGQQDFFADNVNR